MYKRIETEEERIADSALRRKISRPCSDALWEWSDAINYNDLALCRRILDAGWDVNTPTVAGFPALIECIREKKLELAKLLIERGTDPNCYDPFGWSALLYAVRGAKLDICRQLVTAGASLNFIPAGASSETKTPFEEAVWMPGVDMVAIVRFFIEECGADPAQRTAKGRTLIQIAGDEVKVYLRSLKTGAKLRGAIGSEPAASTPARVSSPTGLL